MDRYDFTSPGILSVAKKLEVLHMSKAERKAYDESDLAYIGQELDIAGRCYPDFREAVS